VIDGATGNSTQIATPVGPWGSNALSAIAVNEGDEQTLRRRFDLNEHVGH